MSYQFEIQCDATGHCHIYADKAFFDNNAQQLVVGEYVTLTSEDHALTVEGRIIAMRGNFCLELALSLEGELYQSLYPPKRASFVESVKDIFYICVATLLVGATVYGAVLS